jgi:ADP-ribosylglycohydrolase
MALRLAESLIERRTFDAADVLRRYLLWWHEDGLDSGPTAAHVFSLIERGVSPEQAAAEVHRLSNQLTAGCNPTHRAIPLALASVVADHALADAAMREAALTHLHPLAGQVSASALHLCRLLIEGSAWSAALEQSISADLWREYGNLPLSRGGFAPSVLFAALHFVDTYPTFEQALLESIAFAGGANYCPVLVGALAGARWGRAAIPDALLRHEIALLPQLEHTAQSFCALNRA